MESPVAIQIEALGKTYRRRNGVPIQAVKNLTLAVPPGQVFGFGFIVAGAVLIFKQVESFINLMGNMLLFLNGTLLPVEAMPGWMAGIARALPSTQGVIVLRRVVLGGQSLASTWKDGSLKWLTVHSAVFFAVGWAVFSLCERAAKEQGSLGQY